jgi:predicted nucleotidyltransferase
MLTKEEILNFLSSKKEEFAREFQVSKLGIFGSYATDSPNELSDVDILVEFEGNPSNLHEKKNQIREILSKRFKKEVDLCREKYIKPYFKEQITKTAIYV